MGLKSQGNKNHTDSNSEPSQKRNNEKQKHVPRPTWQRQANCQQHRLTSLIKSVLGNICRTM